MTAEELGRLFATVLFSIACLDRFYILPRKIKTAEVSTDSGAGLETEKLQRRLAFYRRGGWFYIFMVGCILNVILLITKLFG